MICPSDREKHRALSYQEPSLSTVLERKLGPESIHLNSKCKIYTILASKHFCGVQDEILIKMSRV